MSYTNIFKILILFTLVCTVCLSLIKPKMHTNLMIYNSDYKVVEKQVEQRPVVSTVEQTTLPQLIPQTTVKTVKTVQREEKIAKAPTVAKEETKTVVQPKGERVQTSQTVNKLTQEEIAWNVWRSNLQNQIMQDVVLPNVPIGTVFKFTFEVDKYGKISNVQTWSLDKTYTPMAIEHIAPVIRGYQGRAILNFPSNSNRITTKVEGGWRISDKSVFSTPRDYNDTEKVIK